MNKIRHFLNYRPLSILAICGGLRDIVLGLGFLVGWEQITRTLIFQNYDDLIPGVTGLLAGVALIVSGLLVTYTGSLYQRKWMSRGLKAQALLWFFTTLMYVLHGHLALALIFGLLMTIPAGYISYYVKYNPARDEELETLVKPVDKQSEEG